MKQLTKLPFIENFKPPKRKFITINRVQTFLGTNFYPRLNTIYTNICEAISKKNYRYIDSYFETSFAKTIIQQIGQADQLRYKIRMKTPKAKIALIKPKKKMEKYLKFRESVWDNEVSKIGITCNVYFGQQFKQYRPFAEPYIKKIRFGQFRYLMYDPSLSLMENAANIYKHQTYEFIIQYTSKIHLQITKELRFEEKDDSTITSEITMRSGSEKFDWIIIDINGIAKQKGKHRQ